MNNGTVFFPLQGYKICLLGQESKLALFSSPLVTFDLSQLTSLLHSHQTKPNTVRESRMSANNAGNSKPSEMSNVRRYDPQLLEHDMVTYERPNSELFLDVPLSPPLGPSSQDPFKSESSQQSEPATLIQSSCRFPLESVSSEECEPTTPPQAQSIPQNERQHPRLHQPSLGVSLERHISELSLTPVQDGFQPLIPQFPGIPLDLNDVKQPTSTWDTYPFDSAEPGGLRAPVPELNYTAWLESVEIKDETCKRNLDRYIWGPRLAQSDEEKAIVERVYSYLKLEDHVVLYFLRTEGLRDEGLGSFWLPDEVRTSFESVIEMHAKHAKKRGGVFKVSDA
ncbi:hypothetical protein F5B22DRAFT_658758 [Xylaria bambusicola]|uniref:uncharacterized protein n=1 Tax=Xylaria bambusicola TaxID=326684 RepID=UPI0020086FA2|nr:uncharacterized protein F5B22DRAFT_658758 [Xylaria bambusicola]KAI0509011.1 hypothetical protein F5B22DRAFT_658758 [Xylaria bambusicola]